MRRDVFEKVETLSVAAFGLVAALAWNSAIQGMFSTVFGSYDSLFAMFMYAILVTAIAVFVTLWIAKMSKRVR